MANPSTKRKSQDNFQAGAAPFKTKLRKRTAATMAFQMSAGEADESSLDLFVSEDEPVASPKHIKMGARKSESVRFEEGIVGKKGHKLQPAHFMPEEESEEDDEKENREILAKKHTMRTRKSEPARARIEILEKPAKKPRKSEPARVRYEDDYEDDDEDGEGRGEPVIDDEYEEDYGRTSSQQFLKLIEHNEKKKKANTQEMRRYFTQFKKILADGEETIKKQLDEGSAASTKRNNDFLRDFKTAYTAAAPFSNNINKSPEDLNFASLHKKSIDMTRDAMAVIAQFETLTQCLTDINGKSFLANGWENEDQSIADVLAEGKEAGVAKFRAILNRETEGEADREGEGLKAGKLFYKAKAGEEQVESVWGELARKQEKGIKKLVKTSKVDV